jgi:hypothetical protein
VSNRIHGLLTGIHPALERAIGPGPSHPAVLEILSRCGGPAGIVPVTRSSGTSIKGEHPARTGNRKLKRAYFLAAFAAVHDPTSRAYYDGKGLRAKTQRRAHLPRPRPLRRPLHDAPTGTHYCHPGPAPAPAAA